MNLGEASKNNVGHILEGALLMTLFSIPVFAATGSVLATSWISWAMQCAYYLGRERRDHENKVWRERAINLTWGWGALRGWDIWNWSADGKRDLLAPMLGNLPGPVLLLIFI